MSVVAEPAGEPVEVPSVDVAGGQAVAWRHRHLLDVDRLSSADLELVMRTTDAMREVLARAQHVFPVSRFTAGLVAECHPHLLAPHRVGRHVDREQEEHDRAVHREEPVAPPRVSLC